MTLTRREIDPIWRWFLIVMSLVQSALIIVLAVALVYTSRTCYG